MRIFDADVTGSLHVSGSSELKGNLVVSGSQTITGSLTVDGNTKFGDQISDNHNFTGSVNISGSHTLTGSLNLLGNQIVSGSVYILNDLIVQGSSSLENITASAVSIGTNTIILNSDSPGVRYAGISVFDSGSTDVTASLFYDSLTNNWKFQHSDVDYNDSSILIFGPLGMDLDSAPELDGNFLTKVENNGHGHHITTSSIFDNGTKVSINSNSEITGSLIVTNGLSGSLDYSYLINVPSLISGSSQISSLGFITGYTDTNTFTTGATFNTSNGVVTFTKNDGGTYTVDIDGRFLTSYTETDTLDSVVQRGGTTTATLTAPTFRTTGGNNAQFVKGDGSLDGNLYLTSHPSVSAASSSNNSGRTYIQDILLDSFGHITGITTATETVVDTNNFTTGATTNGTTGLITFTKNDGGTYTTSISGYVTTQITNLIDSAPSTLDTLNELAAALGDDPNFATTISTAIGNKVSKSGDTMTGNLSIFKNDTTLTLGQINVSTGFTTIEMYAGNGGAFNGYSIRYNKDATFDRLEFIDGGGSARIYFEIGGVINAAAIKKIGGLSTQFLKADGSVDSSTYLTAHPSVSAASSSNNSGRTYIQDILLDSFGHITGITTATETVTDTNTFITGATFNTGDGVVTITKNDGNTVTVDLDGRYQLSGSYLTGYTETDTLATVTARGNTTNTSITVSGLTSNNDVVISGGTLTVYESVSGATVFAVDGTNGRLFAVTDDLSNSLFSVSTISGLPVIEAFADYRIVMGRFNQNDFYLGTTGEIGMGSLPVSGFKLAVTGNVRATSFVKSGGTSSQFLKADGSVDSNTYLTAHPSVSAASSSNNSGRTYIQDILLDSFGHITGITTASETVTDTFTTGATFNTGDGVITFTNNNGGGTFTVDIDGRYQAAGSYLTAESDTLDSVAQRGATTTTSLTAVSFRTTGGNSSQFVKGDGSLDGNTYLTAHPSVSAASSSNNSGRTYIQDILLDSFGHITGITTASETVVDTNNYTTGVTFNTGDGVLTFTRNDGGTYTVDLDGRYGTSSTDYYTTGATFNTSNGIVTFTRNDGGTYTVDLDGKYLDSSSYTASDVLSKLLTVDGTTSGLDADLLDGQHGSYYYPASNPSGYISSYLNYFTTGATFNTSNGVITFSRNDGNTYTVDIDGKYAESAHIHDDRYLPYESTGDNARSTGWYTIAVNNGNRATGKFILRDTSGGNHQSTVFYATHHFGLHSDITVLINSAYSGTPFRYIRIVDGGTYDGALLQIYVDSDNAQVQAWLLEDIQNAGWIIKDWVPDGVDPGDVPNFPAMVETPAQVDLDNTPVGGIITTGPIFGGGNTTQYEYLNTNNYSTTTDTRYYTETEIGNFFGGSSAITGYNKSNWDTAFGWGNHGTQGYATTGYVQTQITNLIDGAPAALDTLNELAAALGDDANFATTISTSIGAKLPLSGGTMTGNIAFGATSNLGLTWGLNTDAAFIRFISTSNAAGGSYLEIGTQDDSDEEIKFTQSGNLRFYLATDGFLRNGGGYKYVFENGTWGINISGNAATVTNGVYDNGSYSNPAWITALAGSKVTGNISGNASNITSYTINQDLGTSNSVSFSAVASPVYYTTTSSTRSKISLWGSDSNYTIGMESGVSYGGLNDYAMTFQFNNEDDRGFWWGDTSHSTAQGAMALTTNGYLTVARGVRVGYGESDTATPNVPLQVYGSGSLVFDVQGSQGQLFSVTDSLSGSLFSVNDISGLPILEVFSDDRLVAGSYGTNAFVVSGTTTTVSGSFAVSGSATVNGGTVWHSGNDGSGSGLDADTLDGLHASSFLTSYSETDTLASVTARGASTSTQSVFTGGLNARKNQTDNNYTTAALTTESFGNTTTGVAFHISGNVGKFLEMRTDGVLYWDNSKVWTAGTDGASSGLDADTLDGLHASSFLTAHPSVSAASSSDNSGRTYIQDILLDSFGHITGITTATETVVNTDTNYYVTSAAFNSGNGNLTLTRNDGGTVTANLDGRYLTSFSETDTLNSVTTRGASTTNDITIGGLTVGGSLTYGTFPTASNYVTGADNIVLKGNSSGVSGIFFESEKNGTNINHPSDFGFIQFHPYGIGGSSGESNRLVIGVSNDSDDYIVLNPSVSGGLVVRVGADTTEYVVYHAGNIPTWNQNTTGNAATATLASTVTINYNNNSNSNYQLLWGSGNSVYGTAEVYVNPSSDYVYANSFNAGDWFRSTGASGWYNSTYDGGIYMTESTSVRVYNNKGFWIDGGNTNTVNDATLYVTATNNNDWLAIFNAYNSSKSEYGLYVNIASSALYGYALRTDGSSFTYRVDGSGRVYAPIYYDINDTNYYVNPASTSNLATVKLNSTASGTEVFTIDGVNGRLFTITDDLSNSLFSVNTIAGVPVVEVFADNKVIMGRYNQNDLHISSTGEIGMGNTSVSGFKLAVTGNLRATSFVRTGGSSSQFLMADGSVSTNPGWITSYSETDTLDSVLARGASTTRTAEFYQTSNTFINTVTATNRGLTVYQNTAGADAYMTFHISGDYAGYFGLGGAENDLVWGGWSVGNVRYRIWHSGNDGSGSGLDADTLDGQHASAFLTSYSETDTLSSVTARGATTSSSITAERYRGNNSLVLNTFATVNPSSNVFLYSQPNDRDSWIYLDSADTGSNWGIYHRQIDSAVSGLEGNSIGFIGGGASGLRAYIGLSTGNGYFAGTISASNFSGSSSGTNTGDQTNISGNAGTATLASTVTINYNDDTNSSYQMLWGSGNSVYGTAGVYLNPSSDTIYAAAYRGNANVAGTGEAIYAPAGVYSTGTNWLYGTMYLNGNTINEVSQLAMNGTNTAPINITGASSKYITINPGDGYEAMVRYIGGSGSSWYVGKRVTSQVVGTESFHFYSEAASATVGGIDTSGNMIVTGSMRAPIFFDSADTNYFLNPNGYSNLGTVRFNSSGANAEVVAVDGVNGRLFTVTDDMTDSIFSVNTISGLPVIEAFADYKVVMGRYGQNDFIINENGQVSIGSTAQAAYKFTVIGGQWGSYFRGGDSGTGSDIARFVDNGGNTKLLVRGDGNSYFYGSVYINDNIIWHAGNDGSGSGLDADLLDGQHGSYYAAASSLGSYLPLAGGTMTGTITITSTDIRSDASSGWTGDPGVQGKIQYHSNRWYIVADQDSNRIVQFRRNGTDVSYIDNNGVYQGSISGNAGTIDSNPGRTDVAAYPVVWSNGNAQSPNYSCAAVTIQSSTGTLSATTFSGAGTGLTGTASGLSIGGNATTATTAGSITSQANSATITATTAATADRIVLRDGSGDIFSRYSFSSYVNTSDNDESGITRFVIKNGDNYHRSATTTVAADIIRGVASGSWGISISGNAATATSATEVARTVAGGSEANLLSATIGDNDFFRLRVGGGSNAGFAEIATADDGTEPIHVRQYTGVFTSLTRTATLLDGSGNTSFPGTVTAPTFSGALSGNATTATTAGALTSMNISQFTNNSGYITSYSETDTLASVTARGASTSTAISMSGGLTVGRDLYINGGTGGSFGNRLIIGGTTAPYTLEDTNIRPIIYSSGAYPVLTLNHTVVNGSHGPTIQFAHNTENKQWVIGSNGIGTQLDFGYSVNTDRNPHNGIDNYNGTTFLRITNGGNMSVAANLLPWANNTYDLGSPSLGWRNIYTNDLHLSNMNKPEGNDIDGTSGTWTIQEGAENLYIINNLNGKKYRITLEEI